MNLDSEKFVVSEKDSNHAIEAYTHPDCPLGGEACFVIAMGFGGTFVPKCPHFNPLTNAENPECTYTRIEGA